MGSKKEATIETCRIRVTGEAEKDKEKIIRFVANKRYQALNAVRVADAIQRRFVRIGYNPWAFKECEEIPTVSKMYRKTACYSWSIVYRITRTEVIILGVIHQSAKASRIRALRRIK